MEKPPSTARDAPREEEILRCVHRAMRTRHYSRNTEAAYTLWIRRYLRYTRSRDPKNRTVR